MPRSTTARRSVVATALLTITAGLGCEPPPPSSASTAEEGVQASAILVEPSFDGGDGGDGGGDGGSYSWTAGAWSACSAACGGGAQYRDVLCVNGNGEAVPEASCDPGARPTTRQSCNVAPCASYFWAMGSWGACSVACGGGTQIRVVACFDNLNHLVNNANCDPNKKPATSQACNAQPCVTYSWTATPWGVCSVACGGGTQSRTVSCVSNLGALASDANCDPRARPATQQSCNVDPCPYAWAVGPWSACSVPCGGGTRSRAVACFDSQLHLVNSALCDPATRPASSQSCNAIRC